MKPVEPLCATMAVLAVLFLLACAALYYRWSTRRLRALASLLPGGPALPLVGNAFSFNGSSRTSNFHTLVRTIESHGPTCKLWLAGRLFVLIADPDDVQTVLCIKDPTRDQFLMSVLRPFTADGLITSHAANWRLHRKLIEPTFHSKVLQQFISVFHTQAHLLTETLVGFANGSTFDVFPHIGACTLNIICETTMGAAPTNNGREFGKSFHRGLHIIEERIAKPWLLFNWIFSLTKLGKEQMTVINTLNISIDSQISKTLKFYKGTALENTDNQQKTVTNSLDLLIKSAGPESDIVNREFLRNEIHSLLIAGMETTATTMSFVLVLLGIHQDIQEAVLKEQEQIFQGDIGQPLTVDQLQQMKYLERVIRETLRLFPAAPIVTREIQRDLTINGYTLPAGCTAMVISYYNHRNPTYFPRPEQFDPDRFLPEISQGRHPYAYIPFGAGPRSCIGQKYAMLEMKTVLAHILRHYRVFPGCSRDSLNDLEMGMVLRPRDGFKIQLQLR